MQRARMRQRGGSKAVALIVLALVLIGAGGGIVWYFVGREQPEDVVQRLIDAQAAKNVEGVKACLSEASLKLVAGRESLLQQSLVGVPGTEQPQMTVGSAQISADKATVPVSIKLSGAYAQLGLSELTIKYALVKEKGAWKVDLEETARGMMGMLGGLMQGAPGG